MSKQANITTSDLPEVMSDKADGMSDKAEGISGQAKANRNQPQPTNILTELTALLTGLAIPFETGAYKGKAPDEYVVIDPLADTFALYADNLPQNEIQEARLSIYSKGNYIRLRNKLTKALIAEDFTVTDRRYLGLETETLYHHYILEIEIEKDYEYEKED